MASGQAIDPGHMSSSESAIKNSMLWVWITTSTCGMPGTLNLILHVTKYHTIARGFSRSHSTELWTALSHQQEKTALLQFSNYKGAVSCCWINNKLKLTVLVICLFYLFWIISFSRWNTHWWNLTMKRRWFITIWRQRKC